MIKLTDLLKEAKDAAGKEMEKRFNENKWEYTPEYLDDCSSKIGYSAIKYFDLKQTREGSYKFSYDAILDPRGNTAVYLFYNYVRMCSLGKKLNLNQIIIDEYISKIDINISHEKERALLINILRFNDIMDEVVAGLSLNKLADYLYTLSVKFSEFFDECRIKDSEHEKSRVLLVELSKRFLSLGFDLLGLTPVDRI